MGWAGMLHVGNLGSRCATPYSGVICQQSTAAKAATTHAAGKLKAKDLVEFLKPFAGPKGGAGTKGKADNSSKADSKGSGTSKPFAEEKDAAQQKAAGQEPAKKAQPQEDVQDPVSAVVDLTADDLPTVLEGDDAWLFGVFEGESRAAINCSHSPGSVVSVAAFDCE